MARVQCTDLPEATDRSSKKHLHGGKHDERGGFSVGGKEVTRWDAACGENSAARKSMYGNMFQNGRVPSATSEFVTAA